MGAILYTSRRSTRYADGALVALDIDFQDAIRFRDVRKNVIRASNGDPETIYEGADTRWELEFEPVAGDVYGRLDDFLRATAGGEAFQVWIYGTEASPITVKRKDQGYKPQPLLRTGGKQADPFVARITVIEV